MKRIRLMTAILLLASDVCPPISGAEQASTAGMVMIRGGEFMAGLDPDAGLAECRKYYNDCHDSWFVFEKPHRESVRSFSMDKYEVTQAQYEKVMGNNPSNFRGSNLPVDGVTWDEANNYCQRIGKRLPTEWEWEYAARGGHNTLYAWGDNGDDSGRYTWYWFYSTWRRSDPRWQWGDTGRYAGYSHIKRFLANIFRHNGHDAGRYAWYVRNSGGTTHPVGQKEPNGYGLHDMAGNVLEWTASDFDSGHKVLRGGSWADNLFIMRSAGRYYYGPSTHDLIDYGFRCAL
jgi:formylglycine-generating enzyme required for sulfatase activity